MTVLSPIPVLEFDGVSRVYAARGRGSDAGQVVALNSVSLRIGAGEFVGIVGPSGGGKSTLLNLAGALDHPTSGRVLYGGRPIPEFGPVSFRRHHVGFVFQDYHLLASRSARDNVALGLMFTGASRRQAQSEAREWLQRLGLADRADHIPSTLSGGECQRVAIARAMIKRPALLLADEPTGNLDQSSRRDVLTAMSRLHREFGTTVLMVTHTPAEAQAFCSRMVTIDRHVVHEELLTSRVS